MSIALFAGTIQFRKPDGLLLLHHWTTLALSADAALGKAVREGRAQYPGVEIASVYVYQIDQWRVTDAATALGMVWPKPQRKKPQKE